MKDEIVIKVTFVDGETFAFTKLISDYKDINKQLVDMMSSNRE